MPDRAVERKGTAWWEDFPSFHLWLLSASVWVWARRQLVVVVWVGSWCPHKNE